jgi:2-haloacid dehalogenase
MWLANGDMLISFLDREWKSSSQIKTHHVRSLPVWVRGKPSEPERPAVVVFDVFGTVVDWRGSVISAGGNLTADLELSIDWGRFATEWRREGYLTPIMEVSTGQREWTPVDRLLEDSLGVLLRRYGLGRLTETDRQQLLSVWRRLTPWPDAVAGLSRLKARYLIGPLSNGGFALLTEMAKAGGLPWDFVISSELFRAYKPSPEVYTGAVRLLQRSPGEVMLVAAHTGDLKAARAIGMRTAYVPRLLEWGPESSSEPDTGIDRFDIVARDFLDLSQQLGS